MNKLVELQEMFKTPIKVQFTVFKSSLYPNNYYTHDESAELLGKMIKDRIEDWLKGLEAQITIPGTKPDSQVYVRTADFTIVEHADEPVPAEYRTTVNGDSLHDFVPYLNAIIFNMTQDFNAYTDAQVDGEWK